MGTMNDFPVPYKQCSAKIKDNMTDVVICSYEDHIFVCASQIDTMGTILVARKEEGMSVVPTFTVSVVLGKRDEPLLIACARQLIETISANTSKSLVLSLGLRDHSKETIRGIVALLMENRIW